MGKPLRVLIVEDSEEDTELLVRALRRGGFDPEHERVETAKAMSTALRQKSWDVILCDYNLPNFSVPGAQEVMNDAGVDVPFLIVSGVIGEERAADVMKAGAHDLILKDKLDRLAPAIERGLREAEIRWERKKAEAALRESEKRFKDIAESASDWFWEMGPDLRFTYHSPRYFEITGFRPNDKIGMTRTCYVSPSDLEADAKKWAAHQADLEAHRPFKNFEYRFKLNTGRICDVRISGVPVFGQDGAFLGYRGTGTDITERKQAQAQLIQATKLATLGEMATAIAHELNQPLNVIRMAAESTAERLEEGRETDADFLIGKLQRISAQTERMAAIIDHMRIFGRTADDEPELLDPRNAIEDVIGLMGQQLRLRDIVVNIEQPGHCQKILGHRVLIEQVLLNLLSNARDAVEAAAQAANDGDGKARQEITLKVEDDVERRMVRIIVSDTGGGIPEDVIERIFEPFFTTKEVGKGTGLGLSVSYGIIKEMGGTIEAANVDGGVQITITLPAAASEPEAARSG